MAHLYGREEQIAAASSATSTVVLIGGDQGTGKSELLSVLQQRTGEDVIAPVPVSVARHPAALQVALLDSLGAAVALIAEDVGTARLVADQLVDAARRLAGTRLADIKGAVGQFVLDSVRRKLGPTITDVMEDYASELRSSTEDRLLARITAAADPDVIEVFAELANDVSGIHGGRDIFLALDNLERLTDDDMRRLADLVGRLPDRVHVLGTYATSSTDAIQRLDVVRAAGCGFVQLDGLTATAIQDWLLSENLDLGVTDQLMRVTAGYPMYVADGIGLLHSGDDLEELPASSVLGIATERAWRQLSPHDQLAVALMSPFSDPLSLMDAAEYLELDTSAWALLEQRLIDSRVFIAAGERRWFHDLRRKHIRLNLLSTTQRSLAADRARALIDARLAQSKLTAPLLVQRVALMADTPKMLESDPSLAYVMSAALDDIAVASAILQLLDDSAEVRAIDAETALLHARECFQAGPTALDALHRLVSAGVVALASNELAAVVAPGWSQEAALAVAGRAATDLGRLPVPAIATSIFDSFLRPRLGPFDGAHHGVGRPAIEQLATLVASSSSGGRSRSARPAVLVRAVHGNVPLYAAVLYSSEQLRDAAVNSLVNADEELFGQTVSVVHVVSNPLSAVASERFNMAVGRLRSAGGHSLHASQAPDAIRDYTLGEHTSRRAKTLGVLRALCNDEERLAAQLDEEFGYLFNGRDNASLVAQVYGSSEARPVMVDESWRLFEPFARFRLAGHGALSQGQRLGRLSVSSGRSRFKDPALMEILSACERARRFNSRAQHQEILLDGPALAAAIEGANSRAAQDAIALREVVDTEGQAQVGLRIMVAISIDKTKPGWIRGPEHFTVVATTPCSSSDCRAAVRIIPPGEPFVDYACDRVRFANLFSMGKQEIDDYYITAADAKSALARLLGYLDGDVRILVPSGTID